MRDYMTIGSSPVDEKCVNVGEDNYESRSLEECNKYIALIRKKLGPEPHAAQLRTKLFPHDFGSYREVVCYFDDNEPASAAYALACEGYGPKDWKDEEPFDWKKEYEVEYDEVTGSSRWLNPVKEDDSAQTSTFYGQELKSEE